jgi:hypothetical protein
MSEIDEMFDNIRNVPIYHHTMQMDPRTWSDLLEWQKDSDIRAAILANPGEKASFTQHRSYQNIGLLGFEVQERIAGPTSYTINFRGFNINVDYEFFKLAQEKHMESTLEPIESPYDNDFILEQE